jgi:ABC-type phosphate transport system substrate-binding protein
MPKKIFALLTGAAAVAALTACSSSTDPASPSSSSPPPSSGAQPAASGSEIGAAGSACPLPVSISVADKWKPSAIEGEPELLCEISARPAGSIGFLRIYHKRGTTDAKAALTAYTAKPQYSDIKLTDIKAGAVAGEEAAYTIDSSGTKTPGLVFAVPVSDGTVVVSLDSLDEEIQQDNRPAYELAKSSLKVIG